MIKIQEFQRMAVDCVQPPLFDQTMKVSNFADTYTGEEFSRLKTSFTTNIIEKVYMVRIFVDYRHQ